MEYSFGHHHTRREEQEEEVYPPPPQHNHQYQYPVFGGYPPVPGPADGYYPPPPPPVHVQHVSHEHNPNFPPPSVYAPPPHESISYETNHQHQHHHNIHLPSFIHHHSHKSQDDNSNKPTVRVFCKAETDYSLTIRDRRVILARSDPNDLFQHWIKDEKYSTKVKDEQGCPSFALINKATAQAIKHSSGHNHPVQLIPYNPDRFDESILWTESKELGDGYRTIRMINNIRLNLDAFNGDQNHGGVHDGTIVVLWDWKKGDNQRWKIIPY